MHNLRSPILHRFGAMHISYRHTGKHCYRYLAKSSTFVPDGWTDEYLPRNNKLKLFIAFYLKKCSQLNSFGVPRKLYNIQLSIHTNRLIN